MKKLFSCLLLLLVVLSCAACSNKSAPQIDDSNASFAEMDVSDPIVEAPVNPYAGPSQYDKIDVDLTQLSSTMVYSEVYNMLSEPEKYVGKVVKMAGPFALYEDDQTGNFYYACVIADAAACCAQGLEFVAKEERSYPDEYPKPGTYTAVTGVFAIYEENETRYCHMVDAELVY